jgi:hypothetical protein
MRRHTACVSAMSDYHFPGSWLDLTDGDMCLVLKDGHSCIMPERHQSYSSSPRMKRHWIMLSQQPRWMQRT